MNQRGRFISIDDDRAHLGEGVNVTKCTHDGFAPWRVQFPDEASWHTKRSLDTADAGGHVVDVMRMCGDTRGPE